MTSLDLLIFACAAGTCLRLLFYRRGSARFKRHISLLAWLLIVITGSVALCILTGKFSAVQIDPTVRVMLILLTGATWYVRGNIAQLIRLARGLQWK